MARRIQAPGVEVNEIDYSQYADTTDNSIVNTTAFVMGFSDKGMDYATKYVNSINTYHKMFGVPTNEAETYLYHAVTEIINKGGNVYVAKLPYDNKILNKFSYTDYEVGSNLNILSSPYDIIKNNYSDLMRYESVLSDLEPYVYDKTIKELYTITDEIVNKCEIDVKISYKDTLDKFIEKLNLISKDDKVQYDKVNLTKNSNISEIYDFINKIISNAIKHIKIPLSYLSFLLFPDIEFSFINLNKKNSENSLIDCVEITKFLEFCETYKIQLKVVEDFIHYVIDDTNNLNEEENALISELFIKNGVIKNNSTYILSCLYNDVEQLNNVGINISELNNGDINTTNFILKNIQKKLNLTFSFEQIQEKFIRSKKLTYFSEYLKEFFSFIQKLDVEQNWEITKNEILNLLRTYDNNELMKMEYTEIKRVDDTLTSYIKIKSLDQKYSGTIDMELFDKLKTKQQKVKQNTFRIVDITRSKYETEYNTIDTPKQYLGVLPIVTTPLNAMYYQNIIENSEYDFKDFTAVKSIQNIYSNNKKDESLDTDENFIQCSLSNLNNDNLSDFIGFTYNLGPETNTNLNQETTSKHAASLFPTIQQIGSKLDRKHIKDIGVVVFKMEVDKASDYTILLTPVESYVGSLNRKEIDQETKENKFIDDIINSNSSRINFFSNVKYSQEGDVQLTNADKASIYTIANQDATSLGFYKKDCEKTISLQNSIYNAIDRIFDNNTDINRVEIDFIIDAGISNIAQFIYSVFPNTKKGVYDLDHDDAFLFKLLSEKDTVAWNHVIKKYNNFCKNTRKDCMFIADGLRSLCLIGDEKVVRNTKPTNTIENTILKNIKFISGQINSSYGAGYIDWFKMLNNYTKEEFFWCPPSIKASGTYIYTDAYYHYWNAPAGLNRGVIDKSVVDVAFSPTIEQAGIIYNNNWNYAVNYPIDGIIQEGQKTFQRDKTAFDRVNIRRLFLGLEKQVRYIAKYFKYDQITDYLMMRFVDNLTPIFENVKDRGGIKEYRILCDRNNNTTQTIENNELHCTIAVKPIKSLEFLVLNIIATNQSANIQEVIY